ncbi:MAG: hypothetical protein LLG09_03845 [Negativicutes bacterium]|nr:hypothetical protein [Negativicutes bacterium]
MLWMTIVSLRRNRNKYMLAILGLALAVLVSCLGLSGMSILQRATLQPLSLMAGGQVMIMDKRTQFKTYSQMLIAEALDIKPFRVNLGEKSLNEATVDGEFIYTLIAPYRHLYNNDA